MRTRYPSICAERIVRAAVCIWDVLEHLRHGHADVRIVLAQRAAAHLGPSTELQPSYDSVALVWWRRNHPEAMMINHEISETDGGAQAASLRQKRRLSGTHVTIIAVAALVTLVPSAAVAVVSATHSVLVDPKTGSPAYVTNNQLNVRGPVGMTNIVPTQAVTIYRANIQEGKPLGGSMFLQSDSHGRALEIGSINLTGYTLNGDLELFIYTRDVPAGTACTSNPPGVGPGSPGVFFEGLNPGGGSAHQVTWTFPIPMVVEPQANKTMCLYAQIDGYADTEEITLVGAWGTTR